MASWSLSSNATLKIVFSPVSDFRMAKMSFFASVSGTLAAPSPYRTAGIRPSFLSRRAAFFPKTSRFSALIVNTHHDLLKQTASSPSCPR